MYFLVWSFVVMAGSGLISSRKLTRTKRQTNFSQRGYLSLGTAVLFWLLLLVVVVVSSRLKSETQIINLLVQKPKVPLFDGAVGWSVKGVYFVTPFPSGVGSAVLVKQELSSGAFAHLQRSQ